MNINFNKIFLNSFPFLYIVVVIYTFTTIIFFFLPKAGVSFIENANKNLQYQKYNFYLRTANPNGQIGGINNKNMQTLDRYDLKAIVSTSSNKGWIIIEEKSSNKENLTLFYGEEVNGYLLDKIFKDYVIFIKNGKDYILKLDFENNTKHTINSSNKTIQNIGIVQKNNGATITKAYLNSYVNNIEKIWNDIAIIENMNGENIDGFKIERITQNSDFDKLGLKEGDIIKGVNNSKLNSYSVALKIFSEINNIKYLNMEILRNNETMELNYEIN